MEYEKAQQVLERLPETNLLNKDVLQADLFWKQGKLEEAAADYILYSEHQEEIRITDKVLPPLLAMLESDPEYDFLREEQEFQELLEQYRKPEQH